MQMLELPCAIDFEVIVFVAGCDLHLALVFAESKGTKEIPGAVRFIAIHRNPRIEHVVLGETDAVGKTLEEFPQFCRPSGGRHEDSVRSRGSWPSRWERVEFRLWEEGKMDCP